MKKKISTFRTYFATLTICMILVLFIYTAITVYINTSQVALGSDMSIIAAQRQDEGTFVVEIIGRRWYVDIAPVREIERTVTQEYYYALPPVVRLGAPIVEKVRETLRELIDRF